MKAKWVGTEKAMRGRSETVGIHQPTIQALAIALLIEG